MFKPSCSVTRCQWSSVGKQKVHILVQGICIKIRLFGHCGLMYTLGQIVILPYTLLPTLPAVPPNP